MWPHDSLTPSFTVIVDSLFLHLPPLPSYPTCPLPSSPPTQPPSSPFPSRRDRLPTVVLVVVKVPWVGPSSPHRAGGHDPTHLLQPCGILSLPPSWSTPSPICAPHYNNIPHIRLEPAHSSLLLNFGVVGGKLLVRVLVLTPPVMPCLLSSPDKSFSVLQYSLV